MIYGRELFLPRVCVIICRFHLLRSSASSFSSQNLLLFLKLLSTCVLFLPTPFTSNIWPSVASWWRQFILRVWPITFLHMILFRSVLSYTLKNFLISYFLWPFDLLHSLQLHISKLMRYFRSNFLCVQVSEHYKTVFQT